MRKSLSSETSAQEFIIGLEQVQESEVLGSILSFPNPMVEQNFMLTEVLRKKINPFLRADDPVFAEMHGFKGQEGAAFLAHIRAGKDSF